MMHSFHLFSFIFLLHIHDFIDCLSRDSPKAPIPGTQNWKKLLQGQRHFTPRHSHATCIFPCPSPSVQKDCIWLTGGYSDTYRTFNLELSERNADVWFSEDGSEWNPVLNLDGDFIQGVGNYDAKVGGAVAPWYSRYGHSLNAMDANGDGIPDVMILTGGFNPIVSNDVWISTNGTTWQFDGYAPWPARAYHGAVVYKEELWIMGGSPLKNDIWIGRLIEDSYIANKYRMAWRLHSANIESNSFWSPRAAFCTVTQLRRNTSAATNETKHSNETVYTDMLFVIGGFGGYPQEDIRTRNDVWVTSDGTNWTQLFSPSIDGSKIENEMPWGARGWHSCVTWHDKDDRSSGVSQASKQYYHRHSVEEESLMFPRIYLIGGGYFGTHGNNVVRYIEGYVDVWWTVDGSDWNRVDYEEGKQSSLYSTSEIYETQVDSNNNLYLSKWGHSVELLHMHVDDTNEIIQLCQDGSSSNGNSCKEELSDRTETSALVLIGGDTVDGGPIVNDVFMSSPGVHCELQGKMCSGRGICGSGTTGCVCDSDLFIGEYCEGINVNYQSSEGTHRAITSLQIFILGILMIF